MRRLRQGADGNQKAFDLSTPAARRNGVSAAWSGYYDAWKDQAAELIQRSWRAYAEQKYKTAKLRGTLIRNAGAKTQETAALVIQRYWRGFVARQDASVVRKAVLDIQRLWRGCQGRKAWPKQRWRWRKQNAAALEIQRYARGHLVRLRLGKVHCQLPRMSPTDAAVVIQAYYRGHMLRRRHVLEHLRAEKAAHGAARARAAAVIQRFYRGFKARKAMPALQPMRPEADSKQPNAAQQDDIRHAGSAPAGSSEEVPEQQVAPRGMNAAGDDMDSGTPVGRAFQSPWVAQQPQPHGTLQAQHADHCPKTNTQRLGPLIDTAASVMDGPRKDMHSQRSAFTCESKHKPSPPVMPRSLSVGQHSSRPISSVNSLKGQRSSLTLVTPSTATQQEPVRPQSGQGQPKARLTHAFPIQRKPLAVTPLPVMHPRLLRAGSVGSSTLTSKGPVPQQQVYGRRQHGLAAPPPPRRRDDQQAPMSAPARGPKPLHAQVMRPNRGGATRGPNTVPSYGPKDSRTRP